MSLFYRSRKGNHLLKVTDGTRSLVPRFLVPRFLISPVAFDKGGAREVPAGGAVRLECKGGEELLWFCSW